MVNLYNISGVLSEFPDPVRPSLPPAGPEPSGSAHRGEVQHQVPPQAGHQGAPRRRMSAV